MVFLAVYLTNELTAATNDNFHYQLISLLFVSIKLLDYKMPENTVYQLSYFACFVQPKVQHLKILILQ